MEIEFLQVDPPKGGTGAGVRIYLTMVSRTSDAATIWCAFSKGGNEYFKSHRATTPAGGKRQYTGGKPLLTLSKKGKLRLERTGSTLHYSVAQENAIDKFEEIYETELGEDDVDLLRFAADNGGSPTLVDVLIMEVRIKADEFGAVDQLPPPVRWTKWLGILLGAIVVSGGGLWYWRRR